MTGEDLAKIASRPSRPGSLAACAGGSCVWSRAARCRRRSRRRPRQRARGGGRRSAIRPSTRSIGSRATPASAIFTRTGIGDPYRTGIPYPMFLALLRAYPDVLAKDTQRARRSLRLRRARRRSTQRRPRRARGLPLGMHLTTDPITGVPFVVTSCALCHSERLHWRGRRGDRDRPRQQARSACTPTMPRSPTSRSSPASPPSISPGSPPRKRRRTASSGPSSIAMRSPPRRSTRCARAPPIAASSTRAPPRRIRRAASR